MPKKPLQPLHRYDIISEEYYLHQELDAAEYNHEMNEIANKARREGAIWLLKD